MSPGPVLHVFKSTYTRPVHYYLGATKDIRSRTEYFRARNLQHDEVLADSKEKYWEYLASKSRNDLERYTAILFEMTLSPEAINLVRRRAPQAKVVVRSHNAELLHRLHWARAQGLSSGGMRSLVDALKYCVFDYLSGNRADFLLSISRWETDNYWSVLVRKGKAKYVPFFLPEAYVHELQREHRKRKLCVHFGASTNNPLITDATRNFIRAVENLDGRWRDWEFCATGEKPALGDRGSGRIRWTGILDDPYVLLRESRAMALLSNYGFGFKTKILEAILAKAFVLLQRTLYSRLPEEVCRYCIPVDVHSRRSFERALKECEGPFPEGNPNSDLRRQAFGVLDQIFLK